VPDQTVYPRLVWPGRAHDEPELDQPLMVVVLVVLARAAAPAKAEGARFGANGWAASMGCDCTGRNLPSSRASVRKTRRRATRRRANPMNL